MRGDVSPLSEKASEIIVGGLYRHFKGGEYRVIAVGRSSENRDEEYVVYKSLDAEQVWIRPLEMFLENVERDGYKGPRFAFVSSK